MTKEEIIKLQNQAMHDLGFFTAKAEQLKMQVLDLAKLLDEAIKAEKQATEEKGKKDA